TAEQPKVSVEGTDEPNTVEPTDDGQSTGVKVENPTGKTTVTAKDEDGKGVPAKIDPATGEILVTPGEGIDGPITVTVEDPSLDEPATVEVPVLGHAAGIDDNESEDPTDPTTTTSAPQGPADPGKCAASAVGFGLPLLALIPVGLATQVSIPGISEFVENVSKDIERANAQIQRNLGTFNPQTAQALSQMNEQLRKAGFDLATVGAGIAVVAAGILAGTIIYDNCAPGGPKSSVKVDSLQGSSGKTWNSSKKDEK
ncbi:hypothetical protein, partial [Corynebacterium sp. NML180780]|uniref:hypothetical protein n=1 Tax=Corynebacterium sp. NML180780 TaxID=2598459 RepID=UPI00351B0007